MRTRVHRFLVPGCLFFVCVAPGFAQETLIPPDSAEWRFVRGTEEPPEGWQEIDFDDDGWESGQSGFGYGDGDDTTVLDDMSGSYVSVYIRHRFEIANVDDVKVLQIGVQYDDGYIAYINGVEVARSASMGAPGTPAPFDLLSGDHEVNASPEWKTVPADALELLEPGGDNVLAIQGHNATLASSDFSLIPQLRFYDSVCPLTAVCTARSNGGVRVRWTNRVNPVPYEAIEIYRNGELLGSPSAVTQTTFNDLEPPCGENTYRVVAIIDGEACAGDDAPTCTFTPDPAECAGAQFRRGDTDGDGRVVLTDAVTVLTWLFRQGAAPACLDAADADDNGANNLSDAVFLLGHLFRQGPPPPAPGLSACGSDPSDDQLAECVYDAC